MLTDVGIQAKAVCVWMVVAMSLVVRSAQGAEPPAHVEVAGANAILEVKRDDWEDACTSPCEVTFGSHDIGRPLRVRTPDGVYDVRLDRGPDVAIRVSDNRKLRAALGIGSLLGGAASLALLGLAAANGFRHSIARCDDFSHTPNAGDYPNGTTCGDGPSGPSPLAISGLVLSITSLTVGIAAVTMPPFRVDVTPRIAPTSGGRGVAGALLSVTF